MKDVWRVSDEAQRAWVNFDPDYEPREPLTVSQCGYVRNAFLSGFKAAVDEAVAITYKWRDENEAARVKAVRSGRRRWNFDGAETQLVMAEQLEGAAIECNAIAQAIRALASAGEAGTAETTKIGSAEGEHATLEEGDAQNRPG